MARNDWRQETPEKIWAKFNIGTSMMNTVANNIHYVLQAKVEKWTV